MNQSFSDAHLVIIFSLYVLTYDSKMLTNVSKLDLGTQILKLLQTQSLDLNSHYGSSLSLTLKMLQNGECSSFTHLFTGSDSKQVSLV